MAKVFLREKKLKHGKRSLYLDFYPPIINPNTRTPTRREHLKLTIYERPKTEIEKNHNKETKLIGEHIRARRQLEIQAGDYGFLLDSKADDFLAFFHKQVDSKQQTSESNHYIWKTAFSYFEKFTNNYCRFGDVTEKLCIDFKNYLSDKTDLARNSQASYFSKFKSVCRTATENKLFKENPALKVSVSEVEVQKEFLTLEELQQLAVTPFRYESLRRASLFAALTGLRFSDIQKLSWKEIQHSKDQGYYIRFQQQKTKNAETLPISDEAFELLGTRGDAGERVFTKLNKYHCLYLPLWIKEAGIDRNISFHCFRHTFAVLQLTLGTDLYTVSKMLGHRDIKTTQIYAKIIDEKKRAAANRITLR